MINESWGIRPILFRIGKIPVESYPVMVFSALAIGTALYFYGLKKEGIKNSNAIYIAIFALTFGAIGAKIPILIMYWDEINNSSATADILLTGRTVLGGLIGGAVGTFASKKIFNIKEKMGNQLAIPTAVGMAIGRIGCVLRGCCYGTATNLPFGMDFGDHILRHPTQIYESIFDISLAFYLYSRKKKGVKPGELFKIFLNYYLSFRFLIEFIRVEKVAFFIFTDFQILCIVSLLWINRKFILELLNWKKVKVYDSTD
jgi:phosphatidylglycerol:prolipoprotein diacylglycerol transferase